MGESAKICHRVCNDLQTLSNLASLAAPFCGSPRELAQALERRAGALSVPYGLRAEKGQPPELDALARGVCQRAQANLGSAAQVEQDLPPLVLSLRLASPLALWLHEIMDNGLRHGRGDNGIGLEISGRRDSQGFWLQVSDNGPGLPAGFDPESKAKLGLKVAGAVASGDLRGEMKLNPGQNGLSVRLQAPGAEFDRLNQEAWA